MRSRFIGRCPVCGGELEVTRLHCPQCDTGLDGRFQTCRFCQLTEEQAEFLGIFIKSRGNIKEVERELGISYPTVRARLDDVIRSLGFAAAPDERTRERDSQRKEILEALSRGEITSDEAVKMFRSIQ